MFLPNNRAGASAADPERQVESKLEIFRIEAETAAQFFYSCLAMHGVARHHKRVFRLFDEHALCWRTLIGGRPTRASVPEVRRVECLR